MSTSPMKEAREVIARTHELLLESQRVLEMALASRQAYREAAYHMLLTLRTARKTLGRHARAPRR